MRTHRDAVLAAACAALALPVLAPRAAGAQRPTAPPAAAPSAAAPAGALGAVYGVVYDSLRGRPLAGATVQLVRADDRAGGRAVAPDSAGAFRLDSLAPGRYLVGFAHPLLDLLRVDAAPRLVEIGPGGDTRGDTVRVDLGVPALARVRPVLCGSEQAPDDSAGLLAGRVRDAADGAPVANATVVLTWTERALGKGGVRTERRRVPVTTGPGGRYVVCGVPFGEELVASAAAPGRASGEITLEVPPLGLVVRDLTLGDTAAVAAAVASAAPAGSGVPAARPRRGDSTAVPVARGTARLTGTVRDSAGRPVRGARASVWGTAATATARGDGSFALGGLPEGTRTLEVRAIGYALRRVPIDLAADRASTVDVRLQRAATLAPVTVFGTPAEPSLKLREFLDRRRHSLFGRFVTAEEIARRNLFDVSGALRGMPGVQVVSDGRFGKTILGRGPYGPCPAVLVLDGMALPPGEDIDRWISPEAVAGIEVYLDRMFAPPQYGSGRLNFCSVVLFWTR
jgi:protocatechuate 3,4-dioxygenase beta subunit